ncbi:hypothetical protein BN126350105 [Stenotrophomonas thermophila]|nr:hypothetical protein BN126350105 [Stenotrophomonas maltophilia]
MTESTDNVTNVSVVIQNHYRRVLALSLGYNLRRIVLNRGNDCRNVLWKTFSRTYGESPFFRKGELPFILSIVEYPLVAVAESLHSH